MEPGKHAAFGVHPHVSLFGGGCRGGLELEDSLTVTRSHELVEAVSDPLTAANLDPSKYRGWIDPESRKENADLCNWKTDTLVGGVIVSQYFSPQAKACVSER